MFTPLKDKYFWIAYLSCYGKYRNTFQKHIYFFYKMQLPKIQREALEIILDVMRNGKDGDRVAAAATVLNLVLRSCDGRNWLELSETNKALFSSIADAIAKRGS